MINTGIVLLLLCRFMIWEIGALCALGFKKRPEALKSVQRYEDKTLRLIFSILFAYRGFRPKIVNKIAEPLPTRFLLIVNHQSLLDIPVIMHYMPVQSHARFIAKKELKWGVPFISLDLRTMGHCLVRRKDDAMRTMRLIAQFAKRSAHEGSCPVIFPEGTRSRTGELGPFYTAGVRKVLEIDRLPVVVAALDGAWNIASLRGFLRDFGKAAYTLHYIALLQAPQDKKQILDTIEEARRLIDAELAVIRNKKAAHALHA